MLYAKYGRSGMYEMQELLKMVNQGEKDMNIEVDNARVVMNSLPDTNWLKIGEKNLHYTFADTKAELFK